VRPLLSRVSRAWRLGLAAAAALALTLTTSLAGAIEVAPIKDHIDDPGHLLSGHDRSDLAERLSKIQKATLIDVAFLIVDAPEDDLEDLGHEAFAKWKLTSDSDSGIIFMVPVHGQAKLIQDRVPPVLTGRELKLAVSADKKNASVFDRIDAISKNAEKLLRLKVTKKKPRGTNRPVRGMVYLTAAVGLFMLAVLRTMNERERRAGTALTP